jgi:hypothetical protein
MIMGVSFNRNWRRTRDLCGCLIRLYSQGSQAVLLRPVPASASLICGDICLKRLTVINVHIWLRMLPSSHLSFTLRTPINHASSVFR